MKNLLKPIILVIPMLLLMATTNCPNTCLTGIVTSTSTGYNVSINGGSGNCTTNGWREGSFPSENYFVRWIFTDGGNKLETTPSNAASPNWSVTTTQSVAFLNSVNTYGDDDDAGVMVGGSGSGNLPSGLSVNSYPASQSNVNGSQFIKITTAHTTNKAAKCNQVLLILTINNDILDNGRIAITEPNLHLHLFHNVAANKITFLSPGQANKYFSFATVNSGNSYAYSNLSKVATWDINNNFTGAEKNVYCLLDLTDNFTSSNFEKVTFTAIVTNTADVPLSGGTNLDNYDLYVGAAFDPNNIAVDKPTSSTCGASGPEEYEYTITFQNVGIAAASSVFINLETDNAIDPNSIKVTEAVIGNGTNLYQNEKQLFKNCNFTSTTQKFNYSKNNIKQTNPQHKGQVKHNVSFSFTNIMLDGTTNPDVKTAIGYVKFKAKTKLSFSDIHNRAGIFFDNNEEIITNLAVTKCLDESLSTEIENGGDSLPVETDGNCQNPWISWLGWIVAGLLLIYILVKRSNNKK